MQAKATGFIYYRPFFNLLALLIFFVACNTQYTPPLFQEVKPEDSGITFSNDLETTPDFNILNYLYFYDGGGVSAGDINKDGLPDLYFTANMHENKLYLNKGNFVFEDITERAGVEGSGDWTTGTTMADVNGDGLLDIYVCTVSYLSMKGRNQLYINNGDSTFTEQAEKFGLDFTGYSKQASFFDYDSDGDLDMYLLNHGIHGRDSFTDAERRSTTDPHAGDRLYRNDSISGSSRDSTQKSSLPRSDAFGRRGQGGDPLDSDPNTVEVAKCKADRQTGKHKTTVFTNVTKQSGIYSSALGYGLGIGVSDLNMDGYSDIYISNDFHENDYLYLNNGDGTFSEVLEKATGHTSRSSMGNDIADINNDGLTDIFVADMLPATEEELKSAVSSETYKVYKIQRHFGYHPQLMKNTLQLNRGKFPGGELFFSEIGSYAGVNATDWSWSALLFDMDNSGQKDLYVTNGIYRRPNNLDYLLYVRQDTSSRSLSRGRGQESEAGLEAIEKMPHARVANAGFINNGDTTFSDQSTSLGFEIPGYSNGAAYADLDNDGDLDLITNNVNELATIQKNMTRERGGGNYLAFRLRGEGNNTRGIGSKVMVYDSSSVQLYELFTTRGFQSSVPPYLTVGTGTSNNVDSVTVIWPDRRSQTLRNLPVNQTLIIDQCNVESKYDYKQTSRAATDPLFTNITNQISLEYSHKEDAWLDFNKQPLTPFMLSTQGPGIAVGDINNDGLEDFFVGGAKWQAGTFFIQQTDGTFTEKTLPTFDHDSAFEDVAAALFDANGDGFQDLYVVSGGNEYAYQTKGLADRFYINNGNGNFFRVGDAFPPIYENGSTVAVADYDADGDPDLFVGSRSVPGNYGIAPNSHLYENQGNGQFKNVTDQSAPGFRQLGMITDARWGDIDQNGTPDLIVVGEWMPIRIFLNKNGRLVKSHEAGLEETGGWWQSVETGDFDGDGDIDFVAGNMGSNSFLKASAEQPVVLYLKDYNEDGQVDPVIGYTKNEKEYPVAPRDEFLLPFEFLRSKFNSYQDYAGKTIQEIFGSTLTEGAWEKKAVTTLQSVYAENQGDGFFEVKPLSDELQWAPVFSFSAGDYDGDGHPDLLAGGNFYEVKPSLGGRYDASYGWYLEGKGDGTFKNVDMQSGGFVVKGETREIKQLTLADGKKIIVVARNDQPLLFFGTD